MHDEQVELKVDSPKSFLLLLSTSLSLAGNLGHLTWVRHPFPFPLVRAVFSCVQTMVWLPVFGVLMCHCCTQRLKKRKKVWAERRREERESVCCISGAFVWRCALCCWSIARLLRVTFTASRWIRIMSSKIMAIKIDSVPPWVQAIDRNAGSDLFFKKRFGKDFFSFSTVASL